MVVQEVALYANSCTVGPRIHFASLPTTNSNLDTVSSVLVFSLQLCLNSTGLPPALASKTTSMDETAVAMKNRSLRTIRTVGSSILAHCPTGLTVSQELEYLTDASVISPQQLSSVLSQLPEQTVLHAPVITTPTSNGVPTGTLPQPPVSQSANTNIRNEKQESYFGPMQSPQPAPPPAYASAPQLAVARALYPYNPTDAGDVALQPNDEVSVLEYVNAEWWKGRNLRTGQEGIFPRSYVKVQDEKAGTGPAPAPPVPATNYGNMPLDVSQGAVAPADPGQPGKFNGAGKKFGKKLGNAAIFGAVCHDPNRDHLLNKADCLCRVLLSDQTWSTAFSD